MFVDNIDAMAMAANTKVSHLNRSGTSYLVSAILAGTYIGIGIVLIFSLGAPLAASGSAFVRLVMAPATRLASSWNNSSVSTNTVRPKWHST